MTTRVVQVREALLAAVEATDELGATGDRGASITAPTVVIGPPGLIYETQGHDPDEARFGIFLVVPASEREAEVLLDLLPVAIEAIEGAEIAHGDPVGAVVRGAEPGTYLSGNTNLPCYNLRTEVAL